MLSVLLNVLFEFWEILTDSAFYIIVGICIAGMLRVILNPNVVLNHLGKGRFSSVVKAAFFGVPLPL